MERCVNVVHYYNLHGVYNNVYQIESISIYIHRCCVHNDTQH